MAFEKPTKGNLYQLTVNQHIHSAHSISKFYDNDGKVEVHFLKTGKTERREKLAKVFCTKRTWDEKAEKGFMAEIENAFHKEIDNIKPFKFRNHHAISKYFLLWRIRYHFHISRNEDVILNNIPGSGLTSKNQEELLEKKGVCYLRDGGVIPARLVTGTQILIMLDHQWPLVEKMKWGLLTSLEGEFLVPDCYHDLAFIPISPNQAYYVGHKDILADIEIIKEANIVSIEKATEYYFAKNLNMCPKA